MLNRYFMIVFALATVVGCGARHLHRRWDSSPFPFTLHYCSTDLQTFTFDKDRTLVYSPSISEESVHARVSQRELDELTAVLSSSEYAKAVRPFRVDSHSTLCAGSPFARIYHPARGAAFDVAMDGDLHELPSAVLVLFDILDDIRSNHVAGEHERLVRTASP